MMAETALIQTEPTLRFGRERSAHGYRLAIEGKAVRIYTRCGLPTTGREYTVTHGVVTCEGCTQ